MRSVILLYRHCHELFCSIRGILLLTIHVSYIDNIVLGL